MTYTKITKKQTNKQKQKQKQKTKTKNKNKKKQKQKQQNKNKNKKTKINKNKNNNIQRSVPLHSKTIIPYKFSCFEDPYCSDISNVVLQINDFTVKYNGIMVQ